MKRMFLGIIFLAACASAESVTSVYEGQGGRQNDAGDLGGSGGVLNYEDAGVGGSGGSDCNCETLLNNEFCGLPEPHEIHEEFVQCACFVPHFSENDPCYTCQEVLCKDYLYDQTDCNKCFAPLINCGVELQKCLTDK